MEGCTWEDICDFVTTIHYVYSYKGSCQYTASDTSVRLLSGVLCDQHRAPTTLRGSPTFGHLYDMYRDKTKPRMVISPQACRRDSGSNSYHCPWNGTKFRQGSTDRPVNLTHPTLVCRTTRCPCAGRTPNIPSTGGLQ